MNRAKSRELCIEVFEEINRELLGRPTYELNLTQNDKVMLEKYLDYVDNTYNLEHCSYVFFVNWIESGFNYWYKPFSKGIHRMIYFNWVFGKKAIDRYERIKHKDNSLDHIKHRSLKTKAGIAILSKYRKRHSKTKYREQYVKVNSIEETEKKRYYNTVEGFLWCVANTTLFNHRSNACILCKNKTNCKESLRESYPKVFKLRGYE